MNPFLPPDPPPLPTAPLLEFLTLESPWSLVLAALIAAIVAWRVLSARHPRRARTACAGFVLFGVGVVILSRVVETPRERLARATRTLVAAVAEADLEGVRSAMTPDAALYWWLNPDGLPLDGVLARVERDFSERGAYRVKEHAILELQSFIEGEGRGRVQVKVRVTSQAEGVPLISWWRLDYVRGDDGRWRVRGLQPLVIPTISNPSGR